MDRKLSICPHTKVVIRCRIFIKKKKETSMPREICLVTLWESKTNTKAKSGSEEDSFFQNCIFVLAFFSLYPHEE